MPAAEQTKPTVGILGEFRSFLLRGNVVDLAVAVVVGAAAAALVKSLVSDLLSPLIGAILGQPDFAQMTFKVGSAVFRYGSFIDAFIGFMTIMAAVFFFVVKPMDRLRHIAGEVEDQGPTDVELLTEIRDLLRGKND